MPYLVTLLIVLFGAGVFWYQTTAAVCPVPLSYRLGNIDQSFDLSRTQALAYIESAEHVWEDRVGRDLFTYDDQASLSVRFVYDERQAIADSEEAERALLDDKEQENEEVRATLEVLQDKYTTLAAAYEERVVAYQAKLSAYNDEVNRYNDRGGAPPQEYERLESERTNLHEEEHTLSTLSDELTTLSKQINRLADKGNALVNSYNQRVNQYNAAYGYTREFTQGDYQTAGYINVYKFSSDTEVVTVLAHEFGHALGLDHVEGSSSLMYYLLEDTSDEPVLSESDLTAYYEVCGEEETVGQKVRQLIRDILVKIK